MKLAVLAAGLLASSPARAGEADPFDGGTITAQVGIGGLAGVLAGGSLGLIGAGLGMVINPRNISTPIVGGVLGVATGVAIGLTWGVDYAGDNRGANGSLLGTGLGAVAGIAAWVGFEVLANRAGAKVPMSVSVLTGIVAVIGGPIVGYHLTAEAPAGKRAASVPIIGLAF